MDVLICEDDPVARSVISDLVEDNGGRVLAAVDSTADAMAFLDRFTPDVVIVDLMLRLSHGVQLVEHIRRRHPDAQVVVFTANDSLMHLHDDAVEVVVKPDFERLGRIITGAAERGGERRRVVRSAGAAPKSQTDAVGFYRLVADAEPDDVLVSVRVDGDARALADDLRSTLRSHDVVLQRTDHVVALLIGGGEDTVRALEQRVRTMLPHLADRITTTVAGGDPFEAFSRLTSA